MKELICNRCKKDKTNLKPDKEGKYFIGCVNTYCDGLLCFECDAINNECYVCVEEYHEGIEKHYEEQVLDNEMESIEDKMDEIDMNNNN